MLKATSCSESWPRPEIISCAGEQRAGPHQPLPPPNPLALHPCLGPSLCSWAGTVLLSAWEAAWPPSRWTLSKLEKPELARGRVRDQRGGGEFQTLRSGTGQVILGSLRPLERGAGEPRSSLRGSEGLQGLCLAGARGWLGVMPSRLSLQPRGQGLVAAEWRDGCVSD